MKMQELLRRDIVKYRQVFGGILLGHPEWRNEEHEHELSQHDV